MMLCKKIRYRDKIAVKIALADTNKPRSKSSNRNEKRAYRCPDCKGWHLTSKGKH